eukprot:GILK01013896.1.p1 GENE.GILK01013896.1~~GILK01013896.1.p1  ORF type:complete len:280 (+),score=9.32 GILK01013896.1:35-841(+)
MASIYYKDTLYNHNPCTPICKQSARGAVCSARQRLRGDRRPDVPLAPMALRVQTGVNEGDVVITNNPKGQYAQIYYRSEARMLEFNLYHDTIIDLPPFEEEGVILPHIQIGSKFPLTYWGNLTTYCPELKFKANLFPTVECIMVFLATGKVRDVFPVSLCANNTENIPLPCPIFPLFQELEVLSIKCRAPCNPNQTKGMIFDILDGRSIINITVSPSLLAQRALFSELMEQVREFGERVPEQSSIPLLTRGGSMYQEALSNWNSHLYR